MNSYLGFSEEDLKELKAFDTAKEISQQPRLWKEIFNIIKRDKEKISSFIKQAFPNKHGRIIMTGAGSSSFVGQCVAPYLDRQIEQKVEAIATTDIVTNPENYLHPDVPTLLISCARSGNSPESVAAFELAEKLVKDLHHIVLTCNPDGSLAKKATQSKSSLLVLMPEGSNDQGFAMTGSFTTMLLSLLLIFENDKFDKIGIYMESIAEIGEKTLPNIIEEIKSIISYDFNRVVYLGSSTLKGLARESALKLLELTRGKVVPYFDSSLGFRHGPKSVLDDKTLVLTYLSNDQYTRRYEVDFLKEMASEESGKKIIVLSGYKDEEITELADHFIYINEDKNENIDDAYLIFSYILYAQILAFYKSIKLGISPDDPSPDGLVNRVVQGVKIHPFEKK